MMKEISGKKVMVWMLISVLMMGLTSISALAATSTITLDSSSAADVSGEIGAYSWEASSKTLFLDTYTDDVEFSLPAGSTVYVKGTCTIANLYCGNTSSSETLILIAEVPGAELNLRGGTGDGTSGTDEISGALNGNLGSITVGTGLILNAGSVNLADNDSTFTIEEGATVNLTERIFTGGSGAEDGYVIVNGELTITGEASSAIYTEVMTIGSTGSVTITGAEKGIVLIGRDSKLTVEEGGYLSISTTATALQVVRKNLDEKSDITAMDVIDIPDGYLSTEIELDEVEYASEYASEYETYSYGYTIVKTGSKAIWEETSSDSPVENGATNILISAENLYTPTITLEEIADITYGNKVELVANVVDGAGNPIDGGTLSFYYMIEEELESMEAEVVNGQATYILSGLDVGEYMVGAWYDGGDDTG